MPWPFLAIARAELGLSDAQLAWLEQANVRSFDALHGLLRASPGLETQPDFGRRQLIERLEAAVGKPLLSDLYRKVLADPPHVFPAMPLAQEALAGAPGPVPDWPGSVGAVRLGEGDAPDTSLLDGFAATWPVLDQAPHNAACVGFAAGAAMERATVPPGAIAPAPLSALFVYQRIPVRFPADPYIQAPQRQSGPRLDGPTRLSEAAEILRSEGICDRRTWPHTVEANARPGSTELAAAVARRQPTIAYWDLNPERFVRPLGVARVIHDLLRVGRPVAVSLPEFQDPALASASADDGPRDTNWRVPHVYSSGIVATPPAGWVITKWGHAVCILAFVQDQSEPLGGWFVFRNSWGLAWATNAPDADREVQVPTAGYGAVAASHVETAVWEILAPLPVPAA